MANSDPAEGASASRSLSDSRFGRDANDLLDLYARFNLARADPGRLVGGPQQTSTGFSPNPAAQPAQVQPPPSGSSPSSVSAPVSNEMKLGLLILAALALA